jgi:hypothetical protein
MAYSLADAGPVEGRRLPVALGMAAACYFLLLALGGRLLNDADTYWQIAVGDWILGHGAMPHADTFSWTMAGAPWISSQWLAQTAFAQVFAIGGWAGVVVLSAATIAAAFGLLTRILLERLTPGPALVLAVGGFVLASPHMVARPHVLAFPVMVVWTAGLVRALDARRAPSFALLPLMTLWANLHGGFTLGLALMAPCALEAIWTAARADRVHVSMRWGLFGVLALIAACVTPYGPESILVTRRILGLGEALSLIGEWRPQDFATFGAFELCLLAGFGFALLRGLTLPPVRLLVVLGLVHMAIAHVRNGEVLGLLAPLFLAAPLAPKLNSREPAAEHGSCLAPSALLLTLVVAATAIMTEAMTYRPRAAITPAAAVSAVKASGKTHLLNSYDFGGYLIAHGVKPFIDGRTELYGEAFFVRHHRALRLNDIGTFLDLLRDKAIDVTLLAPGTPAIALLDRMKGWRRVYADGIAVVHVRTAAGEPLK